MDGQRTVRNSKITLQNNMHKITTSTAQPTLPFYMRETFRIYKFIAKTVMITSINKTKQHFGFRQKFIKYHVKRDTG